MKNKLILGAALLMAAVTETLACTNFIVGKKLHRQTVRLLYLIQPIHTECSVSYIIIPQVYMPKAPCVIFMNGIRVSIWDR